MHITRGILLKLLALALFTIMASLIKAASDVVPPGQAVFFRSAFAMPIIIGWLALRRELRGGLKTTNPLGHFWRGFIGVCSMGLGFAALGMLPLPDVTAIGFAAPLITIILAALLLGERLRLFRLSAIGVGFIGVMIVLAPQLGVSAQDAATLGAICALCSAALRALAQIHIRKLMRSGEETAAVVFYFSLTATLFSLLTLPFGWVVPDMTTTAMLIGAGLIGGVAQIFITASYKFAPASVLAPFDYVQMIYALIAGYVFFAEVPTSQMLLGSAVIMISGALIIWRERQLGIERGRDRAKLDKFG
ncbi:DMT family transporter [Primorskyibacter sp. S187A]|uniref:DMT family transporter n=1 Tax=Primorskyibacter sp. S187A TaxID=3415130 RepID=UPI003C7D9925